MDHQTPRQRSRPPPQPRPASRASTTGSHPRSVSSSASFNPVSPAQSSHPAYRYHHSNCGSPIRPTPQLSREASSELGRQPGVSSLLFEKLQRERRAESDKLGSSASSRHNFDLTASVDNGRASDKASLRSADTESQRPQSSADLDSGKKKGMGVKDMEQVISTLHKQNFDLKLELFHRREKQTKMEERMETLESESKEMQDMNHKLMDELEKRDKAIEEAVAMIINLEAKVDQLVDERNMVKQVETEGFYGSNEFVPSYQQSTLEGGDGATLHDFDNGDKPNVVNRMPSFLSERTATTENLRNVYLGVRGSVVSLRRVSGGPSEADNAMLNGLASPTLSVLSESSFLSVYGQKGGDTTMIPDFDEPLSFAGLDGAPLDHTVQNEQSGGVLPDKRLAPSIRQELYEASDRPAQVDQRQPRQSQAEDYDIYSHRSQQQSRPEPQLTKEEKRAALRRVMTDGQGGNAGGVRLHEHALPPTPDTISSATLHRLKSSNDTLSGGPPDNSHERGWGAPVKPEHRTMAPESKPSRESQRAERLAQAGYDSQPAKLNSANLGANLQRPRSAGDTTVSHRRRESWQSDESDTRSLQSSLDIWLRQGGKPQQDGRASPDLFGFPTSATSGGSWATSSLFDPKSVASRLGAMPSTDFMHDLLSLREALFSPNLPPPPPHRRSSLYAQSGIMNADGTLLANGQEGDHHARRKSDAADVRAETRTPVQQHRPQAPSSDKKNYPPSSWQAPRTGINRLFRRSIDKGSSDCSPCAMEDAAVDANGGEVPAWVARSGVAIDDSDRSGATPPPIMFNPRQTRRSSMSSGQDSSAVKENIVPPVRPQSVAQPGVRKWLPALRQKK